MSITRSKRRGSGIGIPSRHKIKAMRISVKSAVILVYTIFATVAVQAQTGTLRIKVVDENNINLPGASVTLSQNYAKGVSDVYGDLTLVGLKPGRYTLAVSYIGYRPYKDEIVVEQGTRELRIALSPEGKDLKAVTVMGDRLRGQARALNQQLNAGNIGNVISADQIGRFPDQNIGEALRRVPGIAMQNDQGEARDIIIRGLAPQLNSVTLNGTRIPSAEGDNRRIQMDLIPADIIQTLEVSKTLTPDMDADAIGGSVNLVTRSTPNRFRFSGTVSGGKNLIRDGNMFNVSLLGGGRLLKQKLGIMAALTVNDNDYGSDNIEAVWAKRTDGVAYVSEHDIRVYDVRRTRRSANLNLEYKFNKRNTVSLSGMYNWRDDWENRYRLRVTGITPVYTAGAFTGYRGEVRAQTKGGLDNDRIRNTRLEEQIVRNVFLKGEHILGEKAVFEWSSGFARATEYRPNERYLEYNRTNQTGLVMDIADPERPYVRTATPLGAADLNFRRLTEQVGNVFENDWTSRASLKIPIDWFGKDKGTLKFGVRYSDKEKQRENDFYRYTPTASTLPLMRTMSLVENGALPLKNFQPGDKYNPGPFATPAYLGNVDIYNTSKFTPSRRFEEFLAQNYEAREKITAGFVRLDHRFSDKLTAIAGVRVEHTQVDYTGNEVVNSTTLTGTRSLSNAYTNVLPSINLRYEPRQDLVYRFAVTTGIARPGYYELAPYVNVMSADNTITSGNPDLKATRSLNIDLMAEKYFKSVGILSGGVFYKKLRDFIYTAVDPTFDSLDYQNTFKPDPGQNPIPSNGNWIYRTSLNGNEVDLYGIEVAFQRQLDFLPGFWKGFGVYLNYTFTQSNARGVYTADGKKREGLSLPGTAPHLINGSLSFENKKLVARLSANYTKGYIDEIGSSDFFDRYYDSQFFLDFNASYAFTPKFRIFLELNNLTNQPLRYYQGVRAQTMQLEYYRARGLIGVKFDLY
jgi:TonB-dependent receptor